MTVSYAKQTVDSPNPVARFAHRRRLAHSLALASERLGDGCVLDYGCGAGAFVARLGQRFPGRVFGYEPYMTERVSDVSPSSICSSFGQLTALGPFSLITIFEAIEHLDEVETDQFLEVCRQNLTPKGGVLMSGPIMFGPALLLKEVNRCILFRRRPEHGFFELIKASVFGVAPRRALDIKTSHKGFDFRRSVEAFDNKGWDVKVLDFGPLPLGTWYGNSQFYLWLTRK